MSSKKVHLTMVPTLDSNCLIFCEYSRGITVVKYFDDYLPLLHWFTFSQPTTLAKFEINIFRDDRNIVNVKAFKNVTCHSKRDLTGS